MTPTLAGHSDSAFTRLIPRVPLSYKHTSANRLRRVGQVEGCHNLTVDESDMSSKPPGMKKRLGTRQPQRDTQQGFATPHYATLYLCNAPHMLFRNILRGLFPASPGIGSGTFQLNADTPNLSLRKVFVPTPEEICWLQLSLISVYKGLRLSRQLLWLGLKRSLLYKQ